MKASIHRKNSGVYIQTAKPQLCLTSFLNESVESSKQNQVYTFKQSWGLAV